MKHETALTCADAMVGISSSSGENDFASMVDKDEIKALTSDAVILVV